MPGRPRGDEAVVFVAAAGVRGPSAPPLAACSSSSCSARNAAANESACVCVRGSPDAPGDVETLAALAVPPGWSDKKSAAKFAPVILLGDAGCAGVAVTGV